MTQTEANSRRAGQQETDMSLDNTPHTGRPAPEELVPSRYAVKIGEIEVLVISDGVLPLPTKMLGHNVDAAERAVWLDNMFLPQEASFARKRTAPSAARRNAACVNLLRPAGWETHLSQPAAAPVSRLQS